MICIIFLVVLFSLNLPMFLRNNKGIMVINLVYLLWSTELGFFDYLKFIIKKQVLYLLTPLIFDNYSSASFKDMERSKHA